MNVRTDPGKVGGATPVDDSGAPPAPAPHRGLSIKQLLAIAAGIVVLGAVVYFGWRYWTVWRFEASTDDAYVQADVVTIAPQVSGYLVDVPVTDNQPVKAGDLLAKIDPRDYQAAVNQATADVSEAQAAIETATAQLSEQQALIDEAKATLEADKANAVFAAQNNRRYDALAQSGYGSQQNAQQATSQTQSATAIVGKDQSAITAAEKQVGTIQAQLDSAKATLAHNQAVLEQAQLNLGYTELRAPVDGVVGSRSLRVGQYVQPGTNLLAVVPLQATYIVANYKETQLTDVRAGQRVSITVDRFPGQTVHGFVNSLAPASGQEFALLPPDNATGNFTKIVQRIPVKILLDPRDPLAGKLLPGMSVIPTIDLRSPASEQPLVTTPPPPAQGSGRPN